MRAGLAVPLAMLACASLTAAGVLWNDLRSVQGERDKLRVELATLSAARKAADAAGMVHNQLQQRALNDAQRKNMLLDKAARNAFDGTDDADFLDALRRVLNTDPHSKTAPARNPVSGLPDAGDPGRNDANR